MSGSSRLRTAIYLSAASAVTTAAFGYFYKRKERMVASCKKKEVEVLPPPLSPTKDDSTTAAEDTDDDVSEDLRPSRMLRAVSLDRHHEKESTVVISTSEGHTIEGTIASKQEILSEDSRAPIVKSAWLVDNEMKILTFSLLEEAIDITATPTEKEEVSIPDITVKVDDKKDDTNTNTNNDTNKNKEGQGDEERKKREARRRRLDDSDTVIMISPEDLAMMEQLMLQLDDDRELFDCGDDDREYKSDRRRKVHWRKR